MHLESPRRRLYGWRGRRRIALSAAQQAAFERCIRSGGGYAGIHSAADTEYGWPWYGDLASAYFHSHPAIQDAATRVEDRGHVSTAHLPADWLRRDGA